MTALQLEFAEASAVLLEMIRASGHDPHPWTTDALDARTACRRCGARYEVRVRAAGTTIIAPPSPCPPQSPQ